MARPIVKCGMPIIIGTALGKNTSITFFGGYDVFKINVNQSQIVSGIFQTLADTEIEVNWGDGSSNTYSGTSDQAYSHDYGSVGDYIINLIEKSKNCLTQFTMVQSNTDISFDIKNIPIGLIILDVQGSNTISGDVGNAPAGLKNLIIYGNNTISGDVGNAPAGLGNLIIYGNNTISGDVGNAPAGLTLFAISGNNTMSGDVGTIPIGVVRLYIYGNNIISNYTTGIWVGVKQRFIIVPVSPGGLDATEIDNLFIDFDAGVDCSEIIIILTGSNAAPTSASQTARDNIVAEGGTIITN